MTTVVTIPRGSPGWDSTYTNWKHTCLWCLFCGAPHQTDLWFEVER